MKRYNPRVEQTRKKHRLPAWAVAPTFILGIIIVVAALVMAIFPEQIAPSDPTAVDITVRTKAPSAEHIFGTDNYGRDVFSRVVWGTRIDLSIGFFRRAGADDYRWYYRSAGRMVRRLAG